MGGAGIDYTAAAAGALDLLANFIMELQQLSDMSCDVPAIGAGLPQEGDFVSQ